MTKDATLKYCGRKKVESIVMANNLAVQIEIFHVLMPSGPSIPLHVLEFKIARQISINRLVKYI